MNIVTGKQESVYDPEHEQGGEAQLQTLRHPPVRQPGSEVHFAFRLHGRVGRIRRNENPPALPDQEGTAAEHEGAPLQTDPGQHPAARRATHGSDPASRTDRLRPHPVRQGIVPAKHQDPRKSERTGAVLRTVHTGYRNHRVSEKARDAERLPRTGRQKRNGQPASRRIVHADQKHQRTVEQRVAALRALPATGIRPYAERPRHDRPGLRPDAGEIRRRTAAFVHRKSIPVPGAGLVQLHPARYADVLQIRLSLDTAVRQRAAHERADVRSLPAGILPAA